MSTKETHDHGHHDEDKAGLMDTRRGMVSDETLDDSPIPAKRSLGWGVIIPALLWIGLGALIVIVFILSQ